MTKIPFLLTNDDGYDAPGLEALWQCAMAVGGEPLVAAPKQGWSVRSHAVTVNPKEAITAEPLEHGKMSGYIVGGFPADCVRVALAGLKLYPDQKPLVLVGINPGGNVGIDIYYSGTLAAAREAAAFGCVAIAVSQLVRRGEPVNWDKTISWATAALQKVIPIAMASGAGIWNINLPLVPDQQELPEIRLVPMSTDPLAVAYAEHEQEEGAFSYCGPYRDRPVFPGTDVDTIFSGHISVTPLQIDHTNRTLMETVRCHF